MKSLIITNNLKIVCFYRLKLDEKTYKLTQVNEMYYMALHYDKSTQIDESY